MPTFLLIGIPIAVALLLWGILTLPDEEVEVGEKGTFDEADKPKAATKTALTKKKRTSTKKTGKRKTTRRKKTA